MFDLKMPKTKKDAQTKSGTRKEMTIKELYIIAFGLLAFFFGGLIILLTEGILFR